MATTGFAFEAIGTSWNIELFHEIDAIEKARLFILLEERIEAFDKNYSRFRSDSLVTKMSKDPGMYTLPDDAKPMMDLYWLLYRVAKGLMTPLIGSTLVSAGYGADYSLKPGKVVAPPRWEETLGYDFPHLTIKKPALLDFGAAGKGYLLDIVAELLEEEGLSHFNIDAGGDMVYKSDQFEPLEVALEHPTDPTLAIGAAELYNSSICGSAGNRRRWGKYHHIINPKNLESPTDIAALWVTAKTGLVADGLATALFFTAPAVLAEHFDFEYAIIASDLSLKHSKNFPGYFFTDTK